MPEPIFFNKVDIKKETLTQMFSCEFCEISTNAFITEHLGLTASKMAKIWNQETKLLKL